jgi:hypothetical protein
VRERLIVPREVDHFDFIGLVGVHGFQRRQERLDGHMDLDDLKFLAHRRAEGNLVGSF